MTDKIKAANECVYQLKVMLKGSKPPVWRRFLVHGDISLYKLHLILQVVMGWENHHLYPFRIGGIYFSEPDPEDSPYSMKIKNSRQFKPSKVVPEEKTHFLYEYDFGDSWMHEILVEKIMPVKPDTLYPLCIAGKRACPPEDCGGIWGYSDLLEIIRDPGHEEYEEEMEWLGGQFDPEAFNLQAINEKLKRFR